MVARSEQESPSIAERVSLPLLASLTLGLAPFVPEPHVVEKVRWVLAGGEGMAWIDVFDLAMHGAPWVWLLVVLTRVAAEARAAPAAS